MEKLNTTQFRNHLIYWVGLTLFFSVVWGSYDQSYGRNFMVQLWSLPSRMIVVYGTLLLLFPIFLHKERYFSFSLSFFLLLIFCAVFIQRSVMIFFVEGVYLPFNSSQYFHVTELMNTVIDVGIAAIIPIGHQFLAIRRQSKREIEVLVNQNELAKDAFLLIREGAVNHKVKYSEILYIESLKNYLLTKTLNKVLKSYGSISSIEKELPENNFLRVHRSFIVNLLHLESFSSGFIVIKGNNIPIGRNYRQQVKETLNVKFESIQNETNL
ncbi:MAG: LytTR family DNA-binding domain-containing protein [Cyclobacteriaceae bacterium]